MNWCEFMLQLNPLHSRILHSIIHISYGKICGTDARVSVDLYFAVIQACRCAMSFENQYTFISESKFVPGLRGNPTSEQQHGPNFN